MSNSSQSLASFLPACQQRVNAVLEDALQNPAIDPRLSEAMRYACLGGGKRIRPVLVYATALAVDADLANADPPAAAVELIHSYSLAHDDLPAMDNDELRRGKPSLHKAYDEATAILAGDALQSLAFQLLALADSTLQATTRLQMLATLARAVGGNGMVGGQFVDFSVMGGNPDLAALETMHRLKTGALIRASVTLGALTQPAISAESLRDLHCYADCIGLAFQVQDDVLDQISDTQTLGKPQCSDQQSNKPTYVALLGIEPAQTKARELADQARDAISAFGAAADQLRNLAGFIVNRRH